MSKRGQTFGNPPCKIRIEGADGFRPPQRVEMERLGSLIGKFYEGCVQQQQLAGQPGYKKHIALPNGGQLRYSYNDGQETIDVRLSPKESVSAEARKETKTDSAWDWLVIDIEVPTYNTPLRDAERRVIQRLTAAARFHDPALADIPDPTNPDLPPLISSLERFAIDHQAGGLTQQEPGEPPRLLWGFAPAAEQVGGDDLSADPPNRHRCSLLVDIRPFALLDTIKIDIWGTLDLRELDKRLHTVVTRAVANPDNINRCYAQYSGEAAGRAYVEEMFPDIASTITQWNSRTPSYLSSYFLPAGITADMDDSVLTNPDNYGPVGLATDSAAMQTWYFNNQDIFNDPLWEQSYSAQWADNTPPFDWAGGGSWVQGGDMNAYLTQLDTMPMPGDQNFSGVLGELGKQVYSVAGLEFWYQADPTGSDSDGFSFGGPGDPGTPPPNNYAADASGPFARQFLFAAVRNSYIFEPRIQPLLSDSIRTDTATISASALKGYYLAPAEGSSNSDAQLAWSEHKPDYNDVFTAVSSTSGNVWRYGQWEAVGKFPGRWTLGPIQRAQAVPVDDEYVDANAVIDGAKYLGRITFDQTDGGGSFAWTPADQIPSAEQPTMPA